VTVTPPSPRSQFATFSQDTRKYKPYAFTEHCILMLSSVLNSDRAIDVNIQIMKAFVQMRHYALTQNTTNEQIVELRKLLMLYICVFYHRRILKEFSPRSFTEA
jgi:phage regulator Rha-like protein